MSRTIHPNSEFESGFGVYDRLEQYTDKETNKNLWVLYYHGSNEIKATSDLKFTLHPENDEEFPLIRKTNWEKISIEQYNEIFKNPKLSLTETTRNTVGLSNPNQTNVKERKTKARIAGKIFSDISKFREETGFKDTEFINLEIIEKQAKEIMKAYEKNNSKTLSLKELYKLEKKEDQLFQDFHIAYEKAVAALYHNNNNYPGKISNISHNPEPLRSILFSEKGVIISKEDLKMVHQHLKKQKNKNLNV